MAAVIALSTPRTAAAQKRRAAHVWWFSYTAVLGLTGCVAVLTFFTAPAPFSLGALLLLGLVVATVARPELGLWFVAFFGVAGDPTTVPWYPFAKTMSNSASMLFVSNAVVVYPVELLVGATILGWILRMAATGRWELRRGALFRPVMTFGFFVPAGIVVGLGRGGGNPVVALWEARPLLLLVAIYIVATNLIDTPAAFRRLWSALMVAVFIDSLFALAYHHSLSAVDRLTAEGLGDHSAALHANTFFVLAAAMGVMSARSTRRLVLMLIATPVVAYAYLLSQRRAAFVGLVIGMVMLAGMLYRRRRRAFWYAAPVVMLVFGGYLVAFWNSEQDAGFPAQAVKTIVAPGELSDADKGSDLYRYIENYNVVYTIRSQPLTGIGFGQQYLRPIPNADISFAQWWEYRSHNAVLWIWMKMGFGGFLAMLYLFASAIRHGTRRLVRVTSGYDAALLLTAVVFIAMFAVFAYVDIVWDLESMIFLGIAFACISSDVMGDLPDGARLGEAKTAAGSTLTPQR